MQSDKVAKPKSNQHANGLSRIWIVPLLAIILGIWMLIDNWQQQGHEISISFATAEGLEAGKSKVKHRDVAIGIVKEIVFSDDMKSIVAKVIIDKGMTQLLRDDTRFWVVRPRIGNQGVSGIGTLLSGAYIDLAPGVAPKSRSRFIGLEQPPITSSDKKGLRLELFSKGGKPLSPGQPVIYRGFTVGNVESFEFDTAQRTARYGIFIQAPYDALITDNTHFWNAAGFALQTSAQGVKLDVGSLESLLTGGVQFDVPDDLQPGQPVRAPRSFALYDSLESVYENREYDYKEYVILVKDSVGGLFNGAPVEYRGVRIGTVKEPYMLYTQNVEKDISDENAEHIAVLIHIEPERMYGTLPQFSIEDFDKEFQNIIRNGLVASLKSANLLLGTMMVSLDMSGKPIKAINYYGDYPVIPSVADGLNRLTEKLDAILAKIEAMPLEESVMQANKTIKSMNRTLKSVTATLDNVQGLLSDEQTQQLTANVNATLTDLQNVLDELTGNYGLMNDAEVTLQKLQITLDEIQPVFNQLKQKPNALIFGNKNITDQEPQAYAPKRQ